MASLLWASGSNQYFLMAFLFKTRSDMLHEDYVELGDSTSTDSGSDLGSDKQSICELNDEITKISVKIN